MFGQASLCWDKHNNMTKPAVSKGERKDEHISHKSRRNQRWLESCVAPKGQLLTDWRGVFCLWCMEKYKSAKKHKGLGDKNNRYTNQQQL